MREQMSQFRTMPPQPKVKLRVKQYDPSRRSYFARNDDASDGKETPKALERNHSSRKSTAAEKAEDKNGRQPNGQERSNDQENTPKTPANTKQTQTLPTRPPSARSTPSKVEEFEPAKMREIVDSAIERARELGNESLGSAIWFIYEDSKTDLRVNRLLTAVLQQKQSREESIEFQELIKMARKKVKVQHKQSKPPSTASKSKTPSTTDTRHEPSRPKATPKSPVRRTRQSMARTESQVNESHSPTPQAQHHGDETTMDDKKNDEPPSKRVKRSRSASSTSTLSSTHSLDIDPDIEMSDDADTADGRKGSSAQPPKGNFVSKGTLKKPYGSLAGPKLPRESAKDEAEDKEREVKKRKLTRTIFEDYQVSDSSMRSTPRPRLERIKTDNTFPNLPSAPHSGRGTKREFEEMHSPASSVQADLLVPPPPEARRISRSRAATPNVPRTRGTAERGKARIKES